MIIAGEFEVMMLLHGAPRDVAGKVFARFDQEYRRQLIYAAPSPVLVDYVIAEGTREDRLTLASTFRSVEDYLRLLDLGDVEIARQLFLSSSTPRDLRLRIMSMLPAQVLASVPDGHPGPGSAMDRVRLYGLVESDDPEIVAHAVSALLTDRSFALDLPGEPAAILRGFQRLHELGHPGAIQAVIDARQDWNTGLDSSIVDDALRHPGDPELVARAYVVLGSTKYLVQRLNQFTSFNDAMLLLLAPHAPIDWRLMVKRLKHNRFNALLAREPGCPDSLRPASMGQLPRAPRRTWLRRSAERRHVEQLTALLRSGPDCAPVREGLRSGRLAPQLVVAAGSPVGVALGVVRQCGNQAQRAAGTEKLGAIARHGLGEDADAWYIAASLLPDFAGSLSELVLVASRARGPAG